MRAAILLLLILLAAPAPSFAWGFDAHRYITERAIAMLPPELRTFFEARQAFIVERSIDPDLWRTAGFEEESAHHFLDMDFEEYGTYPFTNLPRDYDTAVQKFGREVVQQQGTLPWRTQEIYGKLQRDFASLRNNPPPGYALDDIAFLSAIVSHYVADGHVPLHAVVNYDGQLTNQNGIHSRWEADLFSKYRDRLKLSPPPIQPVWEPRGFMFDVLLASNRAAGELLAADKKASEGREAYDDGYFEAFGRETLPLLERRMSEAISAVASVITGAWEQAGRPSLVASSRPAKRIPRPGQ